MLKQHHYKLNIHPIKHYFSSRSWYWLSLAAEYPNEDTPPMRFFSLSKGEDGTEVEAANTMNGLKNNVLLDEYSAYSDAVLAKSFDSLNEPV